MPWVLKRPLAYADLAEIWSFIADDSEDAADRFLAVLEQKFGVLATQPLIGRLRTELIKDLRSFPVGRYVVFYLPARRHQSVARSAWRSRHRSARL